MIFLSVDLDFVTLDNVRMKSWYNLVLFRNVFISKTKILGILVSKLTVKKNAENQRISNCHMESYPTVVANKLTKKLMLISYMSVLSYSFPAQTVR